jgi:hypothetical protein
MPSSGKLLRRKSRIILLTRSVKRVLHGSALRTACFASGVGEFSPAPEIVDRSRVTA